MSVLPWSRSRWLGLTVGVVATACTPDVHIHIYNYPPETDTDTETGDMTGTMGGTADGGPVTSGFTTTAPGDDGPPPTSGPPPTTAPADADSGDTGGGDNAYPAPDGGSCPADTVYAQPAAGYEFCTPACVDGACPGGPDGDATPFCAFNPDSSNTPCMEGDDTCQGAESCSVIPGGTMGCALAPSHCALLCSEGQQCPTGMECSPVGACMYPTG